MKMLMLVSDTCGRQLTTWSPAVSRSASRGWPSSPRGTASNSCTVTPLPTIPGRRRRRSGSKRRGAATTPWCCAAAAGASRRDRAIREQHEGRLIADLRKLGAGCGAAGQGRGLRWLLHPQDQPQRSRRGGHLAHRQPVDPHRERLPQHEKPARRTHHLPSGGPAGGHLHRPLCARLSPARRHRRDAAPPRRPYLVGQRPATRSARTRWPPSCCPPPRAPPCASARPRRRNPNTGTSTDCSASAIPSCARGRSGPTPDVVTQMSTKPLKRREST